MKGFRVKNLKLFEEHRYLIDRGVRPLALLGQIEAEQDKMLELITQLELGSSGDSIPFVLDRGNGRADYGYASHRWVIDLYKLAIEENGPIPQDQRGCIIGLLLGYSPDSIARFKENLNSRIIRAQDQL